MVHYPHHLVESLVGDAFAAVIIGAVAADDAEARVNADVAVAVAAVSVDADAAVVVTVGGNTWVLAVSAVEETTGVLVRFEDGPETGAGDAVAAVEAILVRLFALWDEWHRLHQVQKKWTVLTDSSRWNHNVYDRA